MKNIIKTIVLFLIITFTNKMNAQLDTLTYVKSFEIKWLYLNRGTKS